MPGVSNDANHCFGCDSEDVEFGSLMPLRVTTVKVTIPDGRNVEVDNPRGSKDFNVCRSCYLAQYAEVYPGEPLPAV